MVIRPAPVMLGLAGLGVLRTKIALLSWFGIRGIGSLYYLVFAIGMGVEPELSRELVSVTPLMNWHQSRQRGRTRD